MQSKGNSVTESTKEKIQYRGKILERNWDKSLKSFPRCYLQSPLLKHFTLPLLPTPLEQEWFVV